MNRFFKNSLVGALSAVVLCMFSANSMDISGYYTMTGNYTGFYNFTQNNSVLDMNGKTLTVSGANWGVLINNLTGCRIIGNGKIVGTSGSSCIFIYYSSGNEVDGIELQNGDYGVFVSGSNSNDFVDLNVHNCTNGLNIVNSQSNVVDGGTFYSNSLCGINDENSQGTGYVGVNCYGNLYGIVENGSSAFGISGASHCDTNTYHGLLVINTDSGAASGSYFCNNVNGYGVYLDANSDYNTFVNPICCSGYGNYVWDYYSLGNNGLPCNSFVRAYQQ